MPEPGDDGRPWGFLDFNGHWVRLPKPPGFAALGPPPFDVTLPDGRVRRIVHDPKEQPNADATEAAALQPGAPAAVDPAATGPLEPDPAPGDAAGGPAAGLPPV